MNLESQTSQADGMVWQKPEVKPVQLIETDSEDTKGRGEHRGNPGIDRL